jgi:succinate-semialdehyde dehydrogenase/glutarate-semialdehyde dehydrogenase
MGAAETRRAIEAADKALPAWRALTAKERAGKLRRWFELMIENQDDLARLMTPSRASRWPKPRAKSPTPLRSSSGSPKKPSASTAT